ncbi:MAG: T9SS type A sorting domain-containing protein [Bacteroidota bacterium]
MDFGTERPQPGDNLTVTINNFQPGTKGMYNLTITATDGEDTALAFVDLTLDEAPNATILTLPANGATDVTSTPTLRFSNVVLSDGYLVEIATDAAFDNIVVSDVSERVSYEAVLELDTEYFWRVTTQNNCGTRISEVFSFTTMKDLAVIASATELEVCTGEAVTFTVSLGESFAMEGAEISVSSDDLPTTATVSYSLNPVPAGGTTDVRIEGLSDQFVGTLNLTVMADDGENNNSTTISVTVTDAPANTNLQSPANNETVFLQDVSLEWSVVDDATAYLVEVAQDANFANVISSERLTANTWTVSLEPGMFFWRVTTFNACGENSTDAFAFIVQSNSTKEIAAFDFDIAPNPAQAGFSLRFNQLPNTDIQIRLMGVDGKLWQEVDLANNALIYYFDTAALASGVYFLQLQTSTGMTTRKLVIR